MADISAWQPISVAIPAEGVAPVIVTVTVADAVAVDIRSDLEGVAIDCHSLGVRPRIESTASRAVDIVGPRRLGALFGLGDFRRWQTSRCPDAALATIDVTPRTRPASPPLDAARFGRCC